MRTTLALLMTAAALVASGCGGGSVDKGHVRSDVLSRLSADDRDRLAGLRVAFGHQSVGYDILAGLEDLSRATPALKMNVVESSSLSATPGITHFRAGKNEFPLTKTEEFVRIIDASGASAPDVALLKFCYIDANPSTDVKAVFAHYRDALAGLKARHPRTTFMHVTMPLRTIQTGWKVSVKNLIGRPIGGYADNTKRQEYNELLRAAYAGREPVFDLASLESTRADGSRMSFTNNGQQGFALAPEYTYDGGHLNEPGRRYVAEQFLVALAQAAKSTAAR
jgi:hypothetical protein